MQVHDFYRLVTRGGLFLVLVASAFPQTAPASRVTKSPAWVHQSNQKAQPLLQVLSKYVPEAASRFGVSGYDEQVIDLKPRFPERTEADLRKVITTYEQELKSEKDPLVRRDLEIMIDAAQREIDRTHLEDKYLVPYIEVPETVFMGIRSLLADQAAAERRPAALVRLRRYAGMEAGYQPVAVLAENFTRQRLKTPGLIGPYKGEIEKNLGQDQYFIDGVDKLFAKYKIAGYEPIYSKLKEQLLAYNEFVKKELRPRARADFRLPRAVYAQHLRDFGIDASAEEIAALGHTQFTEIQRQMQELAPKVAKEKGIEATDYREVIRALKKNQVEGDSIMALYQKRTGEIERIIREHHLVTLPQRPMIFRFATDAESAATPAPHMDMPQLLNNTGQKGAFVLPLKIPAAPGQQGEQKFDDFTYDAAAWTLTAHEGRPGHELQFDTMVERGVSIARAVFAMNSTNAEGWGLYSEWLLFPYMPNDGKLISLQHRLLRAARAILDPELQMGKVTPEQAKKMLTDDVVLSDAMANQEVERYMFWAPGQAPSYLYGYTKLLALRAEVEKQLGAKFDQQRFHDFVLEQGLLPPMLLRKAVITEFVPAARVAVAGTSGTVN